MTPEIIVPEYADKIPHEILNDLPEGELKQYLHQLRLELVVRETVKPVCAKKLVRILGEVSQLDISYARTDRLIDHLIAQEVIFFIEGIEGENKKVYQVDQERALAVASIAYTYKQRMDVVGRESKLVPMKGIAEETKKYLGNSSLRFYILPANSSD